MDFSKFVNLSKFIKCNKTIYLIGLFMWEGDSIYKKKLHNISATYPAYSTVNNRSPLNTDQCGHKYDEFYQTAKYFSYKLLC